MPEKTSVIAINKPLKACGPASRRLSFLDLQPEFSIRFEPYPTADQKSFIYIKKVKDRPPRLNTVRLRSFGCRAAALHAKVL